MSLDISMAIERGEDMMFGEAPLLNDDQHSILTMSVFDSLNDIHAQIKAQDLQEANDRKNKMGEEAEEANKAANHDEMENSSGAINGADALATLYEAPQSPAVNHNVNWAGLFYEGEEDLISEDQESFAEHETFSTNETVSSTDPTTSPTGYTPSDSKEIGLDTLDHYMITEEVDENVVKSLQSYESLKDAPKIFEEEFEDAFNQFDELDDERKTQDEVYPQLKASIRPLEEYPFLDSPPSSPSKSPRCDIQKSVEQIENAVHQITQSIPQVETHVHQVEAPHQVEQIISQVQPDHPAQLLHAEQQPVRPVDKAHQVKGPVVPVEQHVYRTQSAHSIKLPLDQPHLPVYQPELVNQISHAGLYLPQNNLDLQQGIKNAQSMAKMAVRASNAVNKSAPKTILVDAQHVETPQVSQKVVADLQHYGELDMMDGVQAHESNENSYIEPKEQYKQGLAGLFGLTLDQAKSGIRNKKAGFRNTMFEKPKVCLPEMHICLKYAQMLMYSTSPP
jgi:hypothetical protein